MAFRDADVDVEELVDLRDYEESGCSEFEDSRGTWPLSSKVPKGDRCQVSTVAANATLQDSAKLQSTSVNVPITSSNWEKVRQEVTCAICLELLDDPKSMPCLHTYCKKCLMQALTKRPHDLDMCRDTPAINCPLCRAEVALSDQGIEALPSNFSATRIVETVQLQDKLEKNWTPKCDACGENDATASCCDCGGFFLCSICHKAHRRVPATKNHMILSLNELSVNKSESSASVAKRSPLCQKHPEELLKLYCQDCEVLVCRDCVLVKHKSHNYSFVGDVIEDEKQNLKETALQELDEILTGTTKAIDDLEHMQERVCLSNVNQIAQLNSTFEQVASMLNERKETLLNEFHQVREDHLHPLEYQQKELKALKDKVVNCHSFTNDTLRTGTDGEVMSAKKQMLERTKQLKKLYNGCKLPTVTMPTVSVLYNVERLRLKIKRFGTSIDIAQCCLKDLPALCDVNTVVTFKVLLKDVKGKPVSDASSAIKSKVSKACLTEVSVIPLVEELGGGEYSLSFVSAIAGKYVVAVRINGEHLSNSPADLQVKIIIPDVQMKIKIPELHADIGYTEPFSKQPSTLYGQPSFTTFLHSPQEATKQVPVRSVAKKKR